MIAAKACLVGGVAALTSCAVAPDTTAQAMPSQSAQDAANDTPVARALAPTGELRASINLGNPVLATLPEGAQQPVGVSVDLATELARRLHVHLRLVVVHSAQASVANLDDDKADIGFFAVDPNRAAQITFTRPYVQIEGAYAVRNSSTIQSATDVDQPGIRVAVSAGSAYDLYLTRALHHATLVRLPVDGVVNGFSDQHLEVLAGIRSQLDLEASRRGGLHVLDQPFMVIAQAMGVPTRDGTDVADYLSAFVAQMTTSGFVEASLKRHQIVGAVAVKP